MPVQIIGLAHVNLNVTDLPKGGEILYGDSRVQGFRQI